MIKKILSLDESLLGFKKLNVGKVAIDAEIIHADYCAVEELNTQLEDMYEERAKGDLKAEKIANQTYACN